MWRLFSALQYLPWISVVCHFDLPYFGFLVPTCSYFLFRCFHSETVSNNAIILLLRAVFPFLSQGSSFQLNKYKARVCLGVSVLETYVSKKYLPKTHLKLFILCFKFIGRGRKYLVTSMRGFFRDVIKVQFKNPLHTHTQSAALSCAWNKWKQ